MTYDDFRGIAISPVISGCTHAIQTVCNIVNQYIKAGYTANLCAIDLSKAFDKINLHALFIKLMKRQIPNKIAYYLGILVMWLIRLCQMGQLMVGYVYD